MFLKKIFNQQDPTEAQFQAECPQGESLVGRVTRVETREVRPWEATIGYPPDNLVTGYGEEKGEAISNAQLRVMEKCIDHRCFTEGCRINRDRES